jgi:predicted esterase
MENHITFSFTSRYYTMGNKDTAKQVVFAFHGYGQLARFFIQKFKTLEENNIYIVAPEALSRFYLQDVATRAQSRDTRVGASWMTREDRLTDIANYIAFLDAIYKKEVQRKLPVTVLGFSQGAATAARWISTGRVAFDKLLLWGGLLPPDLDFPSTKKILQDKETILVMGNKDPFATDERFAEMEMISKKLEITARKVTYAGGHDIDAATLKSIL